MSENYPDFENVLSKLSSQGNVDTVRTDTRDLFIAALETLEEPNYPQNGLEGRCAEILRTAIFAARLLMTLDPQDKLLQLRLNRMKLGEMVALRDVSANNFREYLRVGLALADFALPKLKSTAVDSFSVKKSEIARALLDDLLKHIRDGKFAIRPASDLDEDGCAAFDQAYNRSKVDVVAFLSMLNFCSPKLIDIVFKEIENHNELFFLDLLAELRAHCMYNNGKPGRFDQVMAVEFVRYSVDFRPDPEADDKLAGLGF